jgi:hypothetical protein
VEAIDWTSTKTQNNKQKREKEAAEADANTPSIRKNRFSLSHKPERKRLPAVLSD